MSDQIVEIIAQKSAKKTVELMNKEKQRITAENTKINDTWVVGDNMLTCRFCAKFSDGNYVPSHLTKLKKGKFGVVDKINPKGEKVPKWRIVESVQRHETNALHIFCSLREDKYEKENREFNKDDEAAGRVTIRSVIKNIKRGGSAEDFQADLDIFHLESEQQPFVVPTKNNSSDAYFKIRDIVFEVLTEDTKKWFSETGRGQIEEISVTLDKVTIQRTSYTALLTYFFNNGVIYIILNKLMVMAVDEYDSEGTARAVINGLQETLGLTRHVVLIFHFQQTC